MPKSLRSQSKSYSNYKHHYTAKGLVGIALSGARGVVGRDSIGGG